MRYVLNEPFSPLLIEEGTATLLSYIRRAVALQAFSPLLIEEGTATDDWDGTYPDAWRLSVLYLSRKALQRGR